MRKIPIPILAVALAAGCVGGEPPPEDVPADSITERQRDSAIGASRLPGAQGVRGALEASDAAASRAATIDSLSTGGQ